MLSSSFFTGTGNTSLTMINTESETEILYKMTQYLIYGALPKQALIQTLDGDDYKYPTESGTDILTQSKL